MHALEQEQRVLLCTGISRSSFFMHVFQLTYAYHYAYFIYNVISHFQLHVVHSRTFLITLFTSIYGHVYTKCYLERTIECSRTLQYIYIYNNFVFSLVFVLISRFVRDIFCTQLCTKLRGSIPFNRYINIARNFRQRMYLIFQGTSSTYRIF